MKLSAIAFIGASILLGASPSFAQGAYQTPSSPYASNSMPEAVGSAPLGARTLRPGSTGIARIGTVGRNRILANGNVMPESQAQAR